MRFRLHRVAALAALVLAAGVFASTAKADSDPLYDNYDSSCGAGTHVAYNPVTGESMRVGYHYLFWLDGPVWWHAWACVSTGSTGGASMGNALYVPDGDVTRGGGVHAPTCPPTSTTCSLDIWAGATRPASGPAVTPDVDEPQGGAICGTDIGGSCAVKQVDLRTGGTVVEVFASPAVAPTPITVPTHCVGINHQNFTLVTTNC